MRAEILPISSCPRVDKVQYVLILKSGEPTIGQWMEFDRYGNRALRLLDSTIPAGHWVFAKPVDTIQFYGCDPKGVQDDAFQGWIDFRGEALPLPVADQT